MSLLSTTKTWGATGRDEISASIFNAIMGLTTIVGLFVFGYVAELMLGAKITWWTGLALIAGAFVGVYLSVGPNIGIKFVGLGLMAGCLGAISGPYIGQYEMGSVSNIAFVTAAITIALGAAGTFYPKSLENWGSALFVALIGLIVVQFFGGFLSVVGINTGGLHTLLDWAGVLIFSLYIIYDFNRAQFVPKTVEQGVSVGIAVFLDVVNLFLRLLSIFGIKTGADD